MYTCGGCGYTGGLIIELDEEPDARVEETKKRED
jgi:hypothetical protein